jgi:hypothetical protein
VVSWLTLGIVWFGMSEEFNGLIAIAIAIGVGLGVGIAPVWIILRRELGFYKESHQKMIQMNKFLEDITLSGIDEKIAMLYGYTNDVKEWESKGIDVSFMTEKIVSDLTALTRIDERIINDQRIRLNEAITRLIRAMNNKKYDVIKIESVAKLLSTK